MSQVVAVVSDMIFRSKIDSTARAVGATVQIVPSSKGLASALHDLDPAKVLIDLSLPGGDAIEAIKLVRAHESNAKIIAFGSHVDHSVLQAAADAGADQVMPRSQFTAELEQIVSDATA